jgi:hypothetical protein
LDSRLERSAVVIRSHPQHPREPLVSDAYADDPSIAVALVQLVRAPVQLVTRGLRVAPGVAYASA